MKYFYSLIKERPFLLFVFLVFLIVLWFNITLYNPEEYLHLSQSFIAGKTYLEFIKSPYVDLVYLHGKFYWPLGPFPAILIIPFTITFNLLNQTLIQGYINILIVTIIFFLCYKLARYLSYSANDSLYLAFAFCFSSVFTNAAYKPDSYALTHSTTAILMLVSLCLYLKGNRNYLLYGIIYSLVFATRFTAGLGVTFFILSIIFDKESLLNKTKNLSLLFFPMLIAGGALLYYNYIRFGNPFNNGYMLANNYLMNTKYRFEMLNYGLFKLKNIPTNIYYYFIKTVDPVVIKRESIYGYSSYYLIPPYIKSGYPGVGFFVTSPIFLYLIKAKLKKRLVKYSLLPIGLILIFLMTYYWPGWGQMGPRYMIDLLPFAYIILLNSFKKIKLTPFVKTLIVASSIFNLYLLITYIFASKLP